jgi:hypothetical protein
MRSCETRSIQRRRRCDNGYVEGRGNRSGGQRRSHRVRRRRCDADACRDAVPHRVTALVRRPDSGALAMRLRAAGHGAQLRGDGRELTASNRQPDHRDEHGASSQPKVPHGSSVTPSCVAHCDFSPAGSPRSVSFDESGDAARYLSNWLGSESTDCSQRRRPPPIDAARLPPSGIPAHLKTWLRYDTSPRDKVGVVAANDGWWAL